MVGGLPLGADDDEQYKEEQPREGMFLDGAMNCWEEFNHLSLSLSSQSTEPNPFLCGWLVLFIEAWSSSQILSGKGANNGGRI